MESLRQRSAGDLIGQTFSLMFGNFGKLLKIQIVFWLPLVILLGSLTAAAVEDEGGGTIALLLVGGLAAILVQPAVSGACVLALADGFTGRTTPVGECFRLAFRRLGSLLLIAIALGMLAFIGVFTLGIMSIIWACMYFVSAQVCLLEELPGGRAMSRSAELTKGSRWDVFAVALVVLFSSLALDQALSFVSAGIFWAADEPSPILTGAFQLLSNMFSGMLWASAGVAVYFNQRVKKESFDLDTLVGLVDEIGARGSPQAGGA